MSGIGGGIAARRAHRSDRRVGAQQAANPRRGPGGRPLLLPEGVAFESFVAGPRGNQTVGANTGGQRSDDLPGALAILRCGCLSFPNRYVRGQSFKHRGCVIPGRRPFPVDEAVPVPEHVRFLFGPAAPGPQQGPRGIHDMLRPDRSWQPGEKAESFDRDLETGIVLSAGAAPGSHRIGKAEPGRPLCRPGQRIADSRMAKWSQGRAAHVAGPGVR